MLCRHRIARAHIVWSAGDYWKMDAEGNYIAKYVKSETETYLKSKHVSNIPVF